ncbi:MAG: ABC transporter permease [Actinomycetota bacterium]|nr:MAG: ABC transporter permease [Actinomycetota bacterium]
MSTTAPAALPGPASPSLAVSVPSSTWRRLRRDRVAMGAFVVVCLVVAAAVFAPVICRVLGIDPQQFNIDLIDSSTTLPKPPWDSMTIQHPLGVEPANGRDTLARILYGARYSLVIAVLAAALSVVLGLVAGVVAGSGGRVADSLISRFMDLMLAFPVLLFSIALVVILRDVDSVLGIGGTALDVAVLVLIIGFFGFAYIGRVVRGQVLSLREREFVDAARSLGASRLFILRREILPNLLGTLIVYATLLVPTYILAEAALSFLGVGLEPPTPSWGQMLSTAMATFSVYPLYMLAPGVAILLTVLALNLFGDGLRDALDPKGAT